MRPEKKVLAEQFSQAAPNYQRAGLVQRGSAEALSLWIRDRLLGSRTVSVIDIGVGTGLMIAELERHFTIRDLLGIDFAPRMISLCGLRWPRFRFECRDAEFYPYPETYQLITSNFTLQWFEDPAAFVRKIRDRLPPGGAFACAVPVRGSCSELPRYIKAVTGADCLLLPMPETGTLRETIRRLPGEFLGFDQLRTFQAEYPDPMRALRSFKEIGARCRPLSPLPYPALQKIQRQGQRDFSENPFILNYTVLFLGIRRDRQ